MKKETVERKHPKDSRRRVIVNAGSPEAQTWEPWEETVKARGNAQPKTK